MKNGAEIKDDDAKWLICPFHGRMYIGKMAPGPGRVLSPVFEVQVLRTPEIVNTPKGPQPTGNWNFNIEGHPVMMMASWTSQDIGDATVKPITDFSPTDQQRFLRCVAQADHEATEIRAQNAGISMRHDGPLPPPPGRQPG